MKAYQYLTTHLDAHHYWWITLKSAEVRGLQPTLLAELEQACSDRSAQAQLLVITTDSAETFLSGYDLAYLQQTRHQQSAKALVEQAQQFCLSLAQLTLPVVILVNGLCANAGLELALHGDYLISLPTATYQQNEIQLGLLPSLGGTYKLTQRLGATQGLNWYLHGQLTDAASAQRLGLSDFSTELAQLPTLLAQIVTQGKRHLSQQKSHFNLLPTRLLALRLNHLISKLYPIPALQVLQKQFIKQWQQHHTHPLRWMQAEQQQFIQLAMSTTARALMTLHHTEQQLLIPYASAPKPSNIYLIGITSLSLWLVWKCLQQGWQVNLQGSAQKATEIQAYIEQQLATHISDPALAHDYKQRFHYYHHVSNALQHCDLILDCTDSNLRYKQELLAELEEASPQHVPILTNSLGLSLKELTGPLLQPARVCGLQFFMPLEQMRLVEVLYDPELTATETIERTAQFVRLIGKLPLIVNSTHYFVVVRLLVIYLVQGMRFQQQGVPTTIIDQAARDFGMQFGPLELADQIGLDVCLQLGELAKQKIGLEIPATLREMVSSNRLGLCSNAGFYRYRNGRRLKPEREHWNGNFELMKTKLVKQMIEEAQICLELGFFEQPALVDLSAVHGIGFPAFRGGPIQYTASQ